MSMKHHEYFTRCRIIDVETTGDPMGSEVIEIAAVDLLRGEIIPMWVDLVRPSSPIFSLGAAIHQITDQDVVNCPTLEEVLPKYLTGVDVIGAHNWRFEKSHLGDALPDKQALCTYKGAVRVWPKAPAHSNQVLRHWLKPKGLIPLLANMPHRALSDAYTTALILRELLGVASIDDLMRWTHEPVLLPRVCFGMHKGRSWEELPLDYLDWIIEKSDLSEDIKYTASHYRSKAKKAA